MKIVIFGSSGMAGSMISAYLKNKYQIIDIHRNQFDVLKDKIPDISCDYAINCIGVTKQKNQENIIDINVNFVKNLSKMYRLIHLSSDCVFSGNTKTPYNKNDIKDCSDIYGLSKSYSELDNIMSIRTSIIGPSKDSFGLFEWFKLQKECFGFTNHIWSGITTLELAKFINFIISNNLYKHGITQIGSDYISKFQLLNLINFIYEYKKNIYPKKDIYINRSLKSDYPLSPVIQQLNELKSFKL